MHRANIGLITYTITIHNHKEKNNDGIIDQKRMVNNDGLPLYDSCNHHSKARI